MNFFEHQEQARRQTRWALLAFGIGMLLTAALVVGVVALTAASGFADARHPAQALLHTAPVWVGAGVAVGAVMVIASASKLLRLRAGGGAVAAELGGVPVPVDTREPRLRRLRNVVEEIAIASGLPVPAVYVLEREPGINAFAAGYAATDAAIAVTRGALEKLTREELQGVVAHEFSHILNGDMRLNIRMMGLLFGLMVFHLIGREIIDGTPGGFRRGGTLVILGYGLLATGATGMLFGRLIKARLSRQREYLADASAVQFTRQTAGLAGALKKIGGLDAGSQWTSPRGEEVSHMLFGDGFGHGAWFATHPPLTERIHRLDPRFRPEQWPALAEQWNDPGYFTDVEDEAPVQRLSLRPAQDMTAAGVVAQVARPGLDDYRHAEALHATLPMALRAAAQSDAEAPTVLLALLIEADAAVADRQRAALAAQAGVPLAARVWSLRLEVGRLHPAQRLPLAALAFPALRARPAAELRQLQQQMQVLALADGHIGAFEFVLARLLSVQIADWLAPAARAPSGRRLSESCDDIALLLSVLADAGSSDPVVAQRAFAAGWAPLFPRAAGRAALPDPWPPALDAALARLDALLPLAKQLLIEAMVKTLSADGRVTVGEVELLRVTCASLHCPLPSALGTVQ